MNGHRTFRAIEIRLLGVFYSVWLHRLVLLAMAVVLSTLLIPFLANIPSAFAQEVTISVKQQVDSLLEKVDSVQTKLDEFGNPDRLFAPDAIKNIRELDKELSSIEQERRKIEKDEAVAKLTDTEKEEYQNKLDSLKDKTSRIGMQIKMLLQYAPLFQSLKSLMDNYNQDRKQGSGIFTLVLYIALFEIVVLLMFAIIGFLWYRKNSENLNELLMLSPRALSNIKNLTSEVDSLIQKVGSVGLSLKNIELVIQPQQTPIQQEQQSKKKQTDLIRAKEFPLQTFCRLYNAAVEDSNERGKFIQRYNPVRIGVINVMARYRSLSIEAIFETTLDGDYYAVAIERSMRYAVVPRFDLTFQESIHGPGAMGQVFDCPNYNSQLRYRNVKVIRPAFFEPASVKQRWMLKEKGELDLGQGE